MSYPASWYPAGGQDGIIRWYTSCEDGCVREVTSAEIAAYRQSLVMTNTGPERYIGKEITATPPSRTISDVTDATNYELPDRTVSQATEATECSEFSELNTDLGWKLWAAIIVSGIVIAGALLAAFLPESPEYVLEKKGSDDEDSGSGNAEDSNPEDAFALSSSYLWGVYDSLDSDHPTDGWKSSSEACYADQIAELQALLGQIAQTGDEANRTVQTEAEQVNSGRETLENLAGGLQLAIPVSENLYFSGPAGPALSYNFQLVVTNSAVGPGTETTRTMHENSAQHAETLTTLTQQYGEAFQFRAAQRETPAY